MVATKPVTVLALPFTKFTTIEQFAELTGTITMTWFQPASCPETTGAAVVVEGFVVTKVN